MPSAVSTSPVAKTTNLLKGNNDSTAVGADVQTVGAATYTISNDVDGLTSVNVKNLTNATSSRVSIGTTSSTASISLQATATLFSPIGLFAGNDAVITGNADRLIIATDAATHPIVFTTDSGTTEVARILTGFMVGTTTDPGVGKINVLTGYRIGNAAATGAVMIGNGNNFTGDTTPTLVDVLTLAAGSTTIAPLNIQAASALKTTPADGDIELDANCLYGCTDVGNRGYIPIVHIVRADSTVTQANDANPHAMFTTPTNGRLTLESGTYRVHGNLAWTSTTTTPGNIKVDLQGAGTAVTAGWLWFGIGQDQPSGGQGSQIGGSWMVTNASSTNIVTAGASQSIATTIDGTFEVTTAGTIIPTQTMFTAAAAVLSVGSYLEFWRVGNNTMTNIGQWD